MKRITLALLALALSAEVFGQQQYKWIDATKMAIYGQITMVDCGTYERIPAKLLENSREPLKWLGSNSAGLYVRFSSNTTTVAARWSTKWDTHMNHMTDTGVRGLDLYMLDGSQWKYLGAGRPEEKSPSESFMVFCLDGQQHEFMVYLPLYEMCTSLEIGIDAGAQYGLPSVNNPDSNHPVIMYGTSILQGGCASRPGMAFTNILSRKLGREVINLGFSGNALLDPEIAEFMASASEPSLFFLDYCPNATAQDIEEKGEAFFRILRDAHPDVPIVLVDDVFYSGYGYDWALTNTVNSKNAAQKALFNKLKKQGEKNIWHLSGEHPLGTDNEPFVDGCHFTDLGMMRYAEFLAPYIQKKMIR